MIRLTSSIYLFSWPARIITAGCGDLPQNPKNMVAVLVPTVNGEDQKLFFLGMPFETRLLMNFMLCEDESLNSMKWEWSLLLLVNGTRSAEAEFLVTVVTNFIPWRTSWRANLIVVRSNLVYLVKYTYKKVSGFKTPEIICYSYQLLIVQLSDMWLNQWSSSININLTLTISYCLRYHYAVTIIYRTLS